MINIINDNLAKLKKIKIENPELDLRILLKEASLKDKDIVLVESSALNKFSSGLGAVTEPISSLVTAITLFKLVN